MPKNGRKNFPGGPEAKISKFPKLKGQCGESIRSKGENGRDANLIGLEKSYINPKFNKKIIKDLKTEDCMTHYPALSIILNYLISSFVPFQLVVRDFVSLVHCFIQTYW